MRRMRRLGGVLAAAGLMAGLTLAVPGAALATSGCPAWDGTQPAVPGPADGSELQGVTVAGACDVWMAGYRMTDQHGDTVTLTEHWTGGSWTAVPSPSPGISAALKGVSAVSPDDVWAVGYSADSTDSGSALALHWDGTSWTQNPVPASVYNLRAVAAVSANDVWAASDGSSLLMRYDGTNWNPSLIPALTPAPGPGITAAPVINGLDAVSADDVWAVGYMPSQKLPLVLHWDGTAWTQQSVPGAGNTELKAVSATGPDDAWAVGATVSSSVNSTVILHWDGTSWTQRLSPSPGSGTTELRGVTALSPTSALAVGDSGSGTPLALRWDGHNWTQIPAPAPYDAGLDAVAAGPAGVWAGGWEQPSSPIQAAAMVFGTVPSVVGQSQAAAAGALNSAGLRSTVTQVTTATGGCSLTALGTVTAVSPAAGTFTAPPVNVSVCAIPPTIAVPAVTGLDDSQAQGTITNAGLTVGTITLSGNCSFPPGTVIRQTPAAGTTASRGSAVSLTEATPPKPHGCAQ